MGVSCALPSPTRLRGGATVLQPRCPAQRFAGSPPSASGIRPRDTAAAMPCGVALILVAAAWAWPPLPADATGAQCASDVSKCLLQEVCQCRSEPRWLPVLSGVCLCLGISLFELMAISDNDLWDGASSHCPVEEFLAETIADTSHLLLGPHTGLALRRRRALAHHSASLPKRLLLQRVPVHEPMRLPVSRSGPGYRWFHNACCQCLGRTAGLWRSR
uniref:Uncharacterized protein n=1 Tax=Sphaerodactylus townsendi TaxID=933632 RepID=A0ACB8EWT9_9SAUR